MYAIRSYYAPKNIKNQSIQIQQKKESDLLAENINDKSIVVLLDEIGKEYTSEQFSRITSYNVCYTKLLRPSKENFK